MQALRAQAAAEVARLANARAQAAGIRKAAVSAGRGGPPGPGRGAGLARQPSLAHRRAGPPRSRALQAATAGPGNAGRTVQQWFGDFAIPQGIVMCESGGNYGAVNPSSGAGGAYQMLPETYKGLGGQVRGAATGAQVRAGQARRQALGRRPRPR